MKTAPLLAKALLYFAAALCAVPFAVVAGIDHLTKRVK